MKAIQVMAEVATANVAVNPGVAVEAVKVEAKNASPSKTQH